MWSKLLFKKLNEQETVTGSRFLIIAYFNLCMFLPITQYSDAHSMMVLKYSMSRIIQSTKSWIEAV